MLLAEIKPRSLRPDCEDKDQCLNPIYEQDVDSTFDFESWDLMSCWKEQQADRFGGGNAAPVIPRSQRQYDGENHFEYCEQLAVR